MQWSGCSSVIFCVALATHPIWSLMLSRLINFQRTGIFLLQLREGKLARFMVPEGRGPSWMGRVNGSKQMRAGCWPFTSGTTSTKERDYSGNSTHLWNHRPTLYDHLPPARPRLLSIPSSIIHGTPSVPEPETMKHIFFFFIHTITEAQLNCWK